MHDFREDAQIIIAKRGRLVIVRSRDLFPPGRT
jgi:hypothetical protein